MIVLGIDPGVATIGFGVIRAERQKNTLIQYGVITTPPGIPLSNRLLQISNDMEELIRTFHPDEMAVEELFFTKNITTGIAVAHGRGVILLAAEKLGVPRGQLVRRHLLPHLLPQFLTGLILQFPHAILHEASVTFLGFGLSSEQPAIGVILSESMQYLTTGRWWLALFPGLALVGVVLLFAALGEQVRRVLDPSSVHQ